MSYRAPVTDIAFSLKHAAGLKTALAEGLYGDLDEETVDSVLSEAGRFASDVIAPLNSVGDKFGTPFKDGNVTTPPGWRDAYTSWAAAGWNGLAAPADWGGQDLPHAVNAACIEMWNSASMAFGIGPVLTMAAIDALHAYGSAALKQEYLGKLISGEWMGTMQLTEPQAGSDVGALRSKAERAADGNYRITGSKIFITYGEHDLTNNISISFSHDCPMHHQAAKAFHCSWYRRCCEMARATMYARIPSNTNSAFMPLPPALWSTGTEAGPWVSSLARSTKAWPACSL